MSEAPELTLEELVAQVRAAYEAHMQAHKACAHAYTVYQESAERIEDTATALRETQSALMRAATGQKE